MGKFMKTFKTSKRKYVTYKNGGRRRTETQVLAGNRGISKSSSELPNHVTEMTVDNELNDEEPVEVNETNRHDQQGGAVSEPVAASMLPQPDYHETDSNIDVSKPTNHPDTTYSAKKTQRLNEWQNLENPFFQAWLQGNTPPSQCCKCGVSSDLYRCTDCSPWDNVCFECLQGRHALPHLHMFQAWKNGTYGSCQFASPVWKNNHHLCNTKYPKETVIIDDKGRQHIRTIECCTCEAEPVTMVRLGLWPSSPKQPKLAFHIDLLRWLNGLMLETQISVKGFCESLKARISKHEKWQVSSEIQNIYKVLVTETFPEFKRFLYKTEKANSLITALDDGSSCAQCHNTPLKIVSLDADFQLVRKASSGYEWQTRRHEDKFFVDQKSVDLFVSEYGQDNTKNCGECNEFQAGNALRSKNKNSKLSETAVYGSTCRHGFPQQFFNLKHGERLAYAVFLIEKFLKEKKEGQQLHVMYDIACMLFSHLKKNNRQDILDKIKLSIPIFHCYGHQTSCQILFSPRRQLGLGLTDGESIERLWSYLGKYSRITKEMTPENRVDLLIDALLHYAQKMNDQCSQTLIDKYNRAVTLERSSRASLEEDLLSCEDVNMETITQWMNNEEDEMKSRKQKANKEILSPREDYALALEEMYLCSENDQSSSHEAGSLQKCKRAVKKLEKKLRVKWDKTSRHYLEHLLTAKNKKRSELMQCIRRAVTERVFMLELMKKYANGQAVAIKVSKQLKKIAESIKKNLEAYNTVGGPPSTFPITLSFNEVKDLDHNVWQHINPVEFSYVAPQIQHKLKSLKALLDRSVEEQSLVKQEMKAVWDFYKEQHALIEESVHQKEPCVRAILIREGLNLEQRLQGLKNEFGPFLGSLDNPMVFMNLVGATLPTDSPLNGALESEVSELDVGDIIYDKDYDDSSDSEDDAQSCGSSDENEDEQSVEDD